MAAINAVHHHAQERQAGGANMAAVNDQVAGQAKELEAMRAEMAKLAAERTMAEQAAAHNTKLAEMKAEIAAMTAANVQAERQRAETAAMAREFAAAPGPPPGGDAAYFGQPPATALYGAPGAYPPMYPPGQTQQPIYPPMNTPPPGMPPPIYPPMSTPPPGMLPPGQMQQLMYPAPLYGQAGFVPARTVTRESMI